MLDLSLNVLWMKFHRVGGEEAGGGGVAVGGGADLREHSCRKSSHSSARKSPGH